MFVAYLEQFVCSLLFVSLVHRVNAGYFLAKGLSLFFMSRGGPQKNLAKAKACDLLTVHSACPHDCPDNCAMLVQVQDGKAFSVRGDCLHYDGGSDGHN
jgi:hypothetical protein